ncbi:MAG: 4Fe-4S single cluster domain-containing protein [bacterium]
MVQQAESLINLSHFEPCSQANGPGKRSVVWVQGCTLKCHGCINQHTWSLASKELIDANELFDRIMQNSHLIEGVTFSGGEPFLQARVLAELSRKLKTAGLSIVCFSGFTLSKLQSKNAPANSEVLLSQIDLLIDGPYVPAQKTNISPLCGSANQQLHFLTDRYSIQDINCPRIEFNIGQDQTILTGFMNNRQGDLVTDLLRAVLP